MNGTCLGTTSDVSEFEHPIENLEACLKAIKILRTRRGK